MSREWKPGDVALCTITNGYGQGETEVMIRAEERASWEWVSPTTRRGSRLVPGSYVTARPLVVIDPEDREQVERLDGIIYADRNDRDDTVDGTQAALREFANPTPPKPDEPQGLGAVVEDADGVLWTRVESGDAVTRNPWYPANLEDLQPDEWSDIAAVKVLSPGWSE